MGEKDNIECTWFDARKAKQFSLDEEFMGFIVNSPKQIMYVFNRRHWFCIKRINGIWWNLDSTLKAPKSYNTKQEIGKLRDWIIKLLKDDAQVMICRKRKCVQFKQKK